MMYINEVIVPYLELIYIIEVIVAYLKLIMMFITSDYGLP